MIQKKICMLGSFAVGKTSLVSQFVSGLFSEKYHTTVGVKIDRKEVQVDGTDLLLMLWDIHGEDEFEKVRLSYLRGMSGYFVVVDGTRPDTLSRGYALHAAAQQTGKGTPHVLLINKSDLTSEWALPESEIEDAEQDGWSVIRTSAKTGQGVEEAFLTLARRILGS